MSVSEKQSGPGLDSSPNMETVYANLARVSHSPADFVIDFAHLLPGNQNASLRARVVMSPLSIKILVHALNENIARYEAAFGEITLSKTSLADQLFRPPETPENPEEGNHA